MTETAKWPAMSIAQAHAMLTAPGSPLEMETVSIGGRPTRVWKNAPPSLAHCFAAGRAHGDKVFIVLDDERVTFEAFARATLALAEQLKADGVKKGDRVAVVMRNLPGMAGGASMRRACAGRSSRRSTPGGPAASWNMA